MVKNEALSLVEWIAYHQAIGVNNFIIANNESSDNTLELIQCLQKVVNIVVFDFPTPKNERPQIPAFNKMLEDYKNQFDYMMFIDADEFVLPLNENFHINDTIDQLFNADVGALAMNWCNYGSNGQIFRENGLVISRFDRHAPISMLENHHYKTLFRTDSVNRFVNPHHLELKKGIYINGKKELLKNYEGRHGLSESVVWDNIRINHYVVKSLQEYFVGKASRGNGSTVRPVDRKSYFLGYDRNEIHETMPRMLVDRTYKKIYEILIRLKRLTSISGLESYFGEYIKEFEKIHYHIDRPDNFNKLQAEQTGLQLWAVSPLGLPLNLRVEHSNGSLYGVYEPNQRRDDVIKALSLNSEYEAVSNLCGFNYLLNLDQDMQLYIDNGISRVRMEIKKA